MKYFNQRRVLLMVALIAFVGVTIINACKPTVSTPGLGALPKPSFSIDSIDGNHFLVMNTTSTPCMAYWTTSASGGKLASGNTDSLHFTFAGTYTVTLYAAAQGGIDSITKTIVVSQNDPNACTSGLPLNFIAGCTSRSWKLAPIAHALEVGPSGPGDGAWWGNAATDPAGARSGDFDDTYTFYFNAAGTYGFNDNGTFFSDNYLSGTQYTSLPDAQMFPTCALWQSGTFNYNFIPNAGKAGLGQIQLVGLGAHLALPKVTNTVETTVPTVPSVTYDVISMTTDNNGIGHMELAINTVKTSNEWWTFYLVSTN